MKRDMAFNESYDASCTAYDDAGSNSGWGKLILTQIAHPPPLRAPPQKSGRLRAFPKFCGALCQNSYLPAPGGPIPNPPPSPMVGGGHQKCIKILQMTILAATKTPITFRCLGMGGSNRRQINLSTTFAGGNALDLPEIIAPLFGKNAQMSRARI